MLMKLLAVDEENIAGGVDAVRAGLLPALAAAGDGVVWLADPAIHERIPPDDRIVRKGLIGSKRSVYGLADAALRRVGGWPGEERISEFRRRLRGAWWKRVAREEGCPVAFFPCVFGQPPPALGIPLVGLIYDINPAIPGAVRENMVRWMEEASAILTVSEFSADELRVASRGLPKKIDVVFPAVRPVGEAWSAVGEVSDFYFPAAPNPHKGHARLFEAMARLGEKGLRPRVVLSGPMIEKLRPDSDGAIAGLDAARRWMGEVERRMPGCLRLVAGADGPRISGLYANTRCVVLPSGYEGFGLPLAEALSYGQPVIASDIQPFREQIERYGAMGRVDWVAPDDVAGLEEAMGRRLRAGPDRLTRDESTRMISCWTWEMAAESVLSIVGRTLDPRRRGA
jgi:glycosyltransferase involved in cell wall biosynthesis